MEVRSFFRNNQAGDRANKDKGPLRNILVLLVSLFLVLLILINYGNILDLVASLNYVFFPSKRSAEYERLTKELIALSGSGRIEYYQDTPQGSGIVGRPSAENASANEILTGNYVYIPGINISAPIVSGTITEPQTILSQLKQGVLLYPGSNLPGQENGGSTVIIGHSSASIPWQKYGRIFSKLPELSEGDIVIVNYNGRKYSYSITGIKTGSVDELAALNVKDDLVLGTCWPIGTDEQRIIVTAVLIAST
ncbi:MAG: class E sortase [Candidatus Yanofskybacteria bacterium]|nr:class E sortase [Candidatus Yanofskybacteria bacterium]